MDKRKESIWLYWDNKPGCISPPEYIQLCWATIQKHCSKDFEIKMVNTDNVKQFLPNISEQFFTISQINNKSNYLRYHLLKEHGGVWLDSDLILFKSLKPMLNLLTDEIDLVATASPTLKYGQPESGFIVSKKNGLIISKAVSLIDHCINLQKPGHVFKWGSLGPGILRQAVSKHRYHHLDHRLMMPIASWEAFRFEGKEPMDRYIIQDSFGCMLFHEMFRQSNSKFLSMTKEQIMESDTFLGGLFRKAIIDDG